MMNMVDCLLEGNVRCWLKSPHICALASLLWIIVGCLPFET